MKCLNIMLVVVLVAVSAMAAFTDIDNAQYYGKINIPKTHAAIDANFASIEAGTETVALDAGKIYVGNADGNRAAVAVSGDVTIATNGVVAIASGVIVNADVKSDAAIVGSKLDLTSGTGNITSSGNISFDSASVWKTFTLSDDYRLIVTPTELTGANVVTNGQALTALSAYYEIAAAGAVTCTVADAAVKGVVFTIINSGTEAITFADSGNLNLSGNAVLGQYDTLSLYAIATNVWVETAQQDN